MPESADLPPPPGRRTEGTEDVRLQAAPGRRRRLGWVDASTGEPTCLQVESSGNLKASLHRWCSQLLASDGDPGSVLEQWCGGRGSAGLAASGLAAAGAPPGVLSAHCC